MTQAPPSLESLMAQVADEFLDRQARGEAPTVEEYAARYPQIAGFLRQMLPTLAILRANGEDEPAVDAGEDGPRRLGDFRILREVGRGGMGVVYEAEQISLGRRVALKVLPFASALDQRQLQRFKTEAQAAGQLHHTHIVPVYFVGEDRGVHFYAMQFIDGRSVADLIHDLRKEAAPTPAGVGDATPPRNALSTLRSGRKPEYFRWAAEAAAQAADALDHAHAHGVVHRDVKPANLLRDHAGQIWVTDFGLAQVRTDVRLTATGDVVGTLRYMSPEQALTPAQVDHRTDVYSLGVTLYEMLTLRPAFPAEDRAALLRQIADREPPSARTIDRTIPPELDVIVRKAMAKEPDDRYGTAKELAADLRRFLDHLPILARRPSLWQHTRKWARRHRHIVTTAVVGVFVALAGATGVLLSKNAEVRSERKNALDANEQLKAEKVAAQEARDEYRRAMFKLLESIRWRHQAPSATTKQIRATAAEIVALLKDLPADRAADPNIRCLIGIALAQEGIASCIVGAKPAGARAFADAEELFAALIAADAAEPLYRHEFASMLTNRGISHLAEKKPDAAAADWDRAIAELRAGLAVDPKHERCRAVLCDTIITIDWSRPAGREVRRPETLADALALADELCAEFPNDPDYRFQRARVRGLLAERRPESEAAGTEAALRPLVPDLRRLVTEYPKSDYYRRELFGRLFQLGKALWRQKQMVEAEAVYQEALVHAKELTRYGPVSRSDYHDSALLAVNLGALIGTTGPRAAEAAGLFQFAIECEERALMQAPQSQEVYRQSVVNQTLMLSRSLGALGKLTEAAEAIERAVRHEGTDGKICYRVGLHFAYLAQAASAAAPEDRAAAESYYQHALSALKRAKDRGFTELAGVRKQPAFAAIKDRPEFLAVTGGK